MSIVEITTRITPRWLERKSKRELVSILWANIDNVDLFRGNRIDPPGGDSVIEWLQDRLENCYRIAATKSGEDRAGWIEDARYFEAAIQAIVPDKSKEGEEKCS